MLKKILLALLWASMLATAATPGLLLGFDYSQWLVFNPRTMVTDASGAIYVFSGTGISGETTPPSPPTVIKLSADGKTLLWRDQLSFSVNAMAVDPTGGVYVTSVDTDGAVTVSKLNDGGTGTAWTSPVLMTLTNGNLPIIAADASGRTYVTSVFSAKLVRLSANGSAIEYTSPNYGYPYSIAADANGAVFLAGHYFALGTIPGTNTDYDYLVRLNPDGSLGFQAHIPNSPSSQVVQVDASGNAVVNSNGVLTRFDSAGKVISSLTLPSSSSFALDQAGNAYLIGSNGTTYSPVKNTLAPCGGDFLSVIAPDGTILQTTYLVGTASYITPSMVVGKDGNVLMAVSPSQTFVPSRQGPLPAGQLPANFLPATASFLISLSPKATADTYPLACVVNGADYTIGPVSPGELVTLFGNGLGPQQGVQTQATFDTPYPTRAADVQVTFDGTPAPIIYAQDGQVNAIVPWSLNTTRNTQICLTYGSVALKCLSWPTALVSPGVFRDYANGRALALNQDGSVNSAANPAAQGSLVSVFATGLGSITPPQADGSLINLPLPNNAITTTVDGDGIRGPCMIFCGDGFTPVPTQVTYYGPAPFRVAGISQINFRISGSLAGYRLRLLTPDSAQFVNSLEFGVYVKGQ